jgi:hypothetical protein
MTDGENKAIIMCFIIFVFFLLKNTPLGFLWKITKIFFISLFAVLLVNKVKGDLKDWWNEK